MVSCPFSSPLQGEQFLTAYAGELLRLTNTKEFAMTDELEQEQATETETEEKGTGTDQTKTVKTFTQEDVNKIVAKEKAAWKRSSDKASTDHETIVDGLRADITKRDEIIQKNVDLLKKDLNIDEEDWELTMADRDVLFQYDYLLKRMEKLGKKDIPRTPSGNGELKQKPTFQHKTSTI